MPILTVAVSFNAVQLDAKFKEVLDFYNMPCWNRITHIVFEDYGFAHSSCYKLVLKELLSKHPHMTLLLKINLLSWAGKDIIEHKNFVETFKKEWGKLKVGMCFDVTITSLFPKISSLKQQDIPVWLWIDEKMSMMVMQDLSNRHLFSGTFSIHPQPDTLPIVDEVAENIFSQANYAYAAGGFVMPNFFTDKADAYMLDVEQTFTLRRSRTSYFNRLLHLIIELASRETCQICGELKSICGVQSNGPMSCSTKISRNDKIHYIFLPCLKEVDLDEEYDKTASTLQFQLDL